MSDTLDSGGNSPSVSEGPTTFAEAFAADASPASDPAAAAQDSATPAVAAEQQSAVPSQATGDDDRSPFIPRARFDEINTKLKDLREWKEARPWADQIQPEHFNQMASWFLRAQTDTRGFALGLLDELAHHPEHGPAIRSELARRLGTRQTAAPAAPDQVVADVDITDATGKVVGRTYSADMLAKRDEVLRRQWRQEFEQEYGPKFKTLDTIEQERQTLAERQEADRFGTSFASELAALPLFDKHKTEIGNALGQMRLASDSPDAVRAAAYQVYLRIVGPKLVNGAQQAVLADLQRKQHASSSVNPATASSRTPSGPSSFHDARLEW